MRSRFAAAVLVALVSMPVAHAQPPPPAGVTTGKRPAVQAYFLRNEVYFLTNGRANAAALVTGDGIVLVDALSAGWGQAVIDSVQRLTYMPVTAIVNTHAHEDHAGANGEYPEATRIVMHENSRRRLAPGAATGRTIDTFGDRTIVTVGSRPLHLYHFGKGHTDGDTIVVIPDINAAYTGDLFVEKALPVVDPAAGGSALALPDTLARAADAITGVDRVVTGHAPWPGSKPNTAGISLWPTWNDFREYAAFVRTFVDAVTAAWKSGRTAGQTAAELRLPERYKDYRLDGAAALVETIFRELGQSAPPKRQ